MRKNKFICPDCGGKLFYWNEIVNEERRTINPTTGHINKKVTIIKGGKDDSGNEGVQCEKCGWLYNTISLTAGSGSGDSIKDMWDFIDEISE